MRADTEPEDGPDEIVPPDGMSGPRRPTAWRMWQVRAGRIDWRVGTLLGGVAVAVAAWPAPITALTGLDPSWRAALHLATADGLHWGTDIVFTYGPLGFLTVPWPIYGPSSLLAILASGALFVALAVVVVAVLRRGLPLAAALIIAFVIVRSIAVVLPPAEQALVVALIATVEVLRRGTATWPVILAFGVAAGSATLVKLSLAIPVVGMAAIVVLAVAPRRTAALATTVGAALLAFLAGWLAMGQPLDGVIPYLRGAVEMVAGYNAAMTRPLGADRQWQLPALMIAWAVVVIGAWLLGRSLPTGRRIGLAATIGLILFVEWKLALRPFPTYVAATGAGALVPFVAPIRERGSHLAAGLAVALVVVVTLGATGIPIESFVSPVRSARTAVLSAWTVVRVDRVAARAETTRRSMRRELALPPEVVAALTGRSTHVEPYEADVTIAWPEIPWRPFPVFQSYNAYTAVLDQMNADMLASDRAPDRILRELYDVPHMTIHGRYRWFESPATNVAMLCRYRETVVTEHWEVLERGPSRCGPAVDLGTIEARVGDAVSVPPAPAGSMIIARVTGIDGAVTDRLRTLFLRPQDWYVRLDDRAPYRLVVDTARNGLLLAVPPAADLRGPFGYGPAVARIAIGRNQAVTPGSQILTYAFEAIPISPPAS